MTHFTDAQFTSLSYVKFGLYVLSSCRGNEVCTLQIDEVCMQITQLFQGKNQVAIHYWSDIEREVWKVNILIKDLASVIIPRSSITFLYHDLNYRWFLQDCPLAFRHDFAREISFIYERIISQWKIPGPRCPNKKKKEISSRLRKNFVVYLW